MLAFLGTKWGLYIVSAGLLIAAGAVIVWRVFAAGENAQKADAAIAGLQKAIVANQAKAAAIRNPNPDRAHDPHNRDTWH